MILNASLRSTSFHLMRIKKHVNQHLPWTVFVILSLPHICIVHTANKGRQRNILYNIIQSCRALKQTKSSL